MSHINSVLKEDFFDVIIVAAGNSRRFSSETPKQLLPLHGTPLFLWSLHTFAREKLCRRIVVSTSTACMSSIYQNLGVDEELQTSGKIIDVVEGGATRQESVMRALQCLRKLATGWRTPNTVFTQGAPTDLKGTSHVMIHDAARPLLSSEVIGRVWEARAQGDGVVPGIVPADTIKMLGAGNEISQTLDRSNLRLIQTPQLFKTSVIADLHQRAFSEQGGDGGAFDDSVLVEQMGLKVVVVDGSVENMKITYPEDWDIVSHWARNRHP